MDNKDSTLLKAALTQDTCFTFWPNDFGEEFKNYQKRY